MLFGSTILEVAIGMIFVYLLLSLICSGVNEVIATNTKRRAWMLEEGIRNLLLDEALGQSLTEDALKLKRVLMKKGEAADNAQGDATTLSNIFYEHPLIKSLYQPRWRGMEQKKPAYIPARTFALTVLDIITPEKAGQSRTIADVRAAVDALPAESNVRRSLINLIEEAEGDLEKLRINIEDWFNVAMDRVSDWYKRRTHRIIFVIGMLLAFILNADSIMILKVLYSEPAVRTALLNQANEFAKQEAARAGASQPAANAEVGAQASNADVERSIKQAQDKLDARIKDYTALENLGVPVGWSNKGTQIARRPSVDVTKNPARFFREWLLKIAGLLITGVAISLGAPFWFDLLNRFVSFRTALKPPEATPEKRPRSMSLTTQPRPPNEPGSSANPLEGGGTDGDEKKS
jgi:hypothetical protein